MIPQRFHGPKQPQMPESHAIKAIPTLKSLAHQAIAVRRASEVNHSFLQDILAKEDCPEFHGCNTKLCREQGHLPQPKTKAIYLPLIDMKPSDPDLMLTAMVRVQELTSQTGQTFSLLTCDQQLYRVAVNVSWDQPERFKDMYLRLGGMHALMSFAGAVGSLMAESRLSDILSEVFGGVPKMMSGKKFPQNVRALRMMAEEVVCGLFMDHHFENTEDLMKALDQIASESRTVKLWVEILVKRVLLMMTYVMAEREGDWLLHLASILLRCRSCKLCTVWLVLLALHGETSPSCRNTFSKGATCDTTHSGHMEWYVERPVYRIHLYEVRIQCWRNNRNHAKVESIEYMGAKLPYLLQDRV